MALYPAPKAPDYRKAGRDALRQAARDQVYWDLETTGRDPNLAEELVSVCELKDLPIGALVGWIHMQPTTQKHLSATAFAKHCETLRRLDQPERRAPDMQRR